MKYWYIISHWACPLCGKDAVHRERTYDKSKAGHEWHDDYDYCDVGPL